MSVAAAGTELDQSIANCIASTNETLDVNVYLWTSQAVLEEMIRASSRGVRVRVLVEPHPTGVPLGDTVLTPQSLLRLALAGITVRAFNTSGAQPARDHAKFLIGDARDVMIMTENLVEDALRALDPNTGYAIRLESPELADDLTAVFEWDFSAGVTLAQPLAPRDVRAAPRSFAAPDGTASLLVAPESSPLPAWIGAVEAAKETIWIETLAADLATLGPSSELGSALVRAAARGVSVRVLFASTYANASAPDGNIAVARALLHSTADLPHPVLAFLDARDPKDSSKLHAKVLLVDNASFIIGSHNLVAAAFSSNREVSLLVRDPRSASDLSLKVGQDFASALEIEAAPLDLTDGLAVGAIPKAAKLAEPAMALFALLLLAGGALVSILQFMGLARSRGRRSQVRRFRFSKHEPAMKEPRTRPPSHDEPDSEPPERPEPQQGNAAIALRASAPSAPEGPQPRLPPTALELFEDN